jgi:TM2 domain-containing membrane protein YozV
MTQGPYNVPPPPPPNYQQPGQYPPPPHSDVSGTKIASGVCGILLGSLGIHKFILGMTGPGLIMLLVTVTTSCFTFGIGALVMHAIGLAEGIIYLTKSDAEFYETYMVRKKEWF